MERDFSKVDAAFADFVDRQEGVRGSFAKAVRGDVKKDYAELSAVSLSNLGEYGRK